MTDPFDLAVDAALTVPKPESQAPAPVAAAPAAPDPFDAAVDSALGNERVQLRTNLIDATRVNADQAARASALGKQRAVPADVALRNLQDLELQAAVDAADTKLRTAPDLLRRFRENSDFARQAHDDLDALVPLHNELKAWSGPKATFGSVTSGLAQVLPQAGAAVKQGIRLQVADMFDTLGILPRSEQEIAADNRRAAQAIGASAFTTPEFESDTAAAVYGGVASTLQQAPGLAASLLTGNPLPVLLSAGLQSEATAYAKYRTRGADAGMALLGGTLEGGVEVATELLPMGFFVDKLGKVGVKDFLAGLLAREIPGEQVATLLQDAVDTAIANPDKTWGEYLEERPGAAYSTLVSTITQTALMGGTAAAVERIARRGQQAEEGERGAAALEKLRTLATESKLRERNPEAFRDMLQAIADNTDGTPKEVFIDARTLADTLQQSGVTSAELAGLLPSVGAQLAEAAQAGGDVAIPVGELLAGTPGTEFEKALFQNLRVTPDGLSAAEAADATKTAEEYFQSEVQGVLDRAASATEVRASADVVKATVLGELATANRFTPDVNDAYARLVADFYSVNAQRLGITPEAMFQQYPLRVGAASPVDNGGVLNQETQRLTELQEAWTAAGLSTTVSENGTEIELSKIVVPKDGRGQGAGTAAMQQLVEYADAAGKRVVLTPSGDFGGNKNRLKDFYKRFGFVENKGRRKDFTTRAGMIREPKARDVLEQPARATFNPSTLQITLLENADLSSFLHESGHFFLEVLADLASQPNAPAQIVADMEATLKWFGVPDLATWAGYSLDEKRPFHEKWAESFEQYLFEGKAPNAELAPLFQRFRAWLTNVYKSLSDFLRQRDNQLSAEVRGVFDRLLATDQEIAEAEAVAGYAPLFAAAEAAGMTPAEWAAYQAAGAKATADATETLQSRSLRDMRWAVAARSKELRRLTKDVAAKRKAVEAEVTAEVEALPVEQARAYLKALRVSSPEDKDALKDWKGRREAHEERVAEEVKAALLASPEAQGLKGLKKGAFIAKNKRLMANEVERQVLLWEQENKRPVPTLPEVEFETVAEQFGFTSGDHLRVAMLESPPAAELIEGMTDQRMLERFGDLTSKQGLEAAASEAVHNEARARFVASELKALQEGTNPRTETGRTAKGRRITVNAMVAQAKLFADNLVARSKVRELRPGVHTAAEARAAKRAAEALAAGKTEDAIRAKNDQVLQHYAARRKAEARDEVERKLEYLKKFDAAGTRKSLPPDYLDQIDKLLERVELRKGTTLRALDKRASLAKWVEAQQAMGLDPVVPDELLAETALTSYKEMTVEEFRGLVDAVRNIEHLGRLKGKLLKAKDQREFDAIAEEVAAEIVANGGTPIPVKLEPDGRVAQFFKGAWADHRKLNSLVRQMDGGKDNGPFYRAFVRSMNESGATEDLMIEKATVQLAELYKPMLALPGGLTGSKSKLFIPEINNSLTRGGRLSIALNWGNAQNRQRVRDGDGWTDAQVAAVLKTLTPVELQFVNDTWAFIDSFWPEIKAKQERVSGVVEDKVEAEPFEMTAADGTVVKMRGGYYPIRYDTNRSSRAEQQEAAQMAADMMRGAVGRATTRRNHTKARVDEVKGRPVRKDLNVLTQHVTTVVHDLAWHEWFIDANRLLGDGRIAGAIRTHYGPQISRAMKEAVEAIAVGDLTHQGQIDRLLLGLRSNISRSVMGFSLTTAFLQPFGLTQSMARVGTGAVLKGAARWAGDAARFESSMRLIGEKSEFMRLRNKSFNREIREISQRIGGKSKAMQVVDGSLFMLMQKLQLVADVPTWYGAYEKALAGGVDEAAAVALADEAVVGAQGGGTTKDLSGVQRNMPFLTQFYSYFNTTLNLVAEKTGTTDFKNPKAVAGWLGDMALLTIVPAILPALLTYTLKGGGEDDEPEEWARRLAEWQASYLFGMFVGLRELPVIWSPFEYGGPPAGRILKDAGGVATQVGQGDVDEPLIVSLANLLGSGLGLPTVQLLRSYKGWKAWDDGDAPPTSVLFGPPPKD